VYIHYEMTKVPRRLTVYKYLEFINTKDRKINPVLSRM